MTLILFHDTFRPRGTLARLDGWVTNVPWLILGPHVHRQHRSFVVYVNVYVTCMLAAEMEAAYAVEGVTPSVHREFIVCTQKQHKQRARIEDRASPETCAGRIRARRT